jgi:CMP-N,N'-diacetyllegionaminic acid synthase
MILGLIAARGGSKRIPNKNMRDFCGWPLIYRTMWQAVKFSAFGQVVLSTDDPEIKRYCAPALWAQMRPAELATDTASKWDVFRYVAKTNELKPDDILVDLDTGCPFRAPEDITACIEKLCNSPTEWSTGYDVVCTAYESDRNPHFNMVEGDDWSVYVVGDGEYNHEITRIQDAPQVWSISPAVFAIKVSALVKYAHWSTVDRMGIVVIPRERAWDIDTEFDWQIAEMIMRRK